jgi:hypothetical protein
MLTQETTFHLHCLLLPAEHEEKHARNNAFAFAFCATLADTPDSKADAEGSRLYWERQAEHAACRVREIKNEIASRREDLDCMAACYERRMGC